MKKVFMFIIYIFFIYPLLVHSENNIEYLKHEAHRIFQAGVKAQQYEFYREALIYYSQALEINLKIENKYGIAINLHNIGYVYNLVGKYDEALEYFNQSLKMYENINDLKSVSMTLNNIGRVYLSLKQYNNALKYYKESLKIREQLNIPRDIALVLHNMSIAYTELSEGDQASIYAKRALEIALDQKIPTVVMACLENLSSLYASEKEWAAKFLEDALEIFKKFQEHHDVMQILFKKLLETASLAKENLAYKDALKYYNVIITIIQEIEKHRSNIDNYIYYRNIKLIAYNNAATIYADLGRFGEAIKYHIDIRNIITDSDTLSTLEINLCGLYEQIGDYQQALESCNTARNYLEHNTAKSYGLAVCYNNIGLIYHSIGDYEKSIAFYTLALNTRKQLIINTSDSEEERKLHYDIVMNYADLGAVFLGQKRYEQAEKAFQEADQWKQKFHSQQLRGNPGLVDLYLVTGRPQKALGLLNAQAMRPSPYVLPESHSLFLTQRGLALAMSGQGRPAASELLHAIAIIEEMRSLLGQVAKTGFLQSRQRTRPYRALIAVLAEEALGGGELPSPQFLSYGKTPIDAAFYFAEATKARSLIEGIAASARPAQLAHLPQELREEEEALVSALAQMDNTWEAAYTTGEATFKQHRERYEKLQGEMERFIARVRNEHPRYAALRYPKPLRVDELPLTDNEILLEYALTEKACYVFVIANKRVERVIKIPLNQEELETLVSAFLRPLQNRYSSETFSHDAAHTLYNLLLREALKDVSPTKEIIIVPDGMFGALPFEALVIKTGKDYKDSLYVGDKWKITYAQSATTLALTRLLQPSRAPNPLFALGNPIYNATDERYLTYRQGNPRPVSRTQSQDQTAFRALVTRREWGKTHQEDKDGKVLLFPALPETENEIKAIAKLFGVRTAPPDVLLNVFANETHLRQARLSNYRYLHFATHADLPGKVQGIKEPFLLLGQVENSGDDDGFLTMTEVMQLTLDADMVVLSACLTGRGEVMAGEGVMNFARAFQHAGARSVVVSLWEVASQEIVEYITTLYGELKAGKGKAEALILARKKMKTRYPHPFYWATLILYGER